MKISSNTILKNDQPFVETVLRRVIPFVDEMIITVSMKSTDGTKEIIERLEEEFPKKIILDYEDVLEVGKLTEIRQHQLDISTGDWIWFLDGDDLWPEEEIKKCLLHFEEDIDGISVTAIQLVDLEHKDQNWWNKSFTKFYKKTPEVHFRNPWPKDMIYKGETSLHWKDNKKIKKVDYHFFHLALLKNYSFRQEHEFYKYKNIVPTKLTEKDITWLSSQNIKGLS